jgi:hypothetical protein
MQPLEFTARSFASDGHLWVDDKGTYPSAAVNAWDRSAGSAAPLIAARGSEQRNGGFRGVGSAGIPTPGG